MDRKILGVALIAAGIFLVTFSGLLAIFEAGQPEGKIFYNYETSGYAIEPIFFNIHVPPNASEVVLKINITGKNINVDIKNARTGKVMCSCISSGTIFKTLRLVPGNYVIEVKNLTESPEFNLSYTLTYYIGSEGERSEVSFALLASLILGMIILTSGFILWFIPSRSFQDRH